eukprot:gb/GECH01010558.1/.p1 GENE.gb/GECH01010558.1/~~gb/GECH01010558.1/.p1  ORF type:complete len:388 (+),score=89.21 gb/GECH01010558.1/:1-1164(+)
MSNGHHQGFVSLAQGLEEWKTILSDHKIEHLQYFVGVDVGASNVRIALKPKNNENYKDLLLTFPEVRSGKIPSNNVTQLVAVLKEAESLAISTLGENCASSAGGAIALAGPVDKHEKKVRFTNYDSDDCLLSASHLPSQLFPTENTHFLNDLEGCCYGILALCQENRLNQVFQPLWGEMPDPLPATAAVLAAGTGLGCGYLSIEGTSVLPLEGGHCQIAVAGKASNQHNEERRLLDYLSAKLYNDQHEPEFEDIVSGRGLKACYDFLCYDNSCRENQLTAGQVSTAALNANDENHERAAHALDLYYQFLMRAAQNLTVCLQPKAVFLCGDNQVSNEQFVTDTKRIEKLKSDFISHPRPHWLKPVPVLRQIVSMNLNLLGCLFVCQTH